MTILLVEDEAEMADLIVGQIRHAGMVVDRMASLLDARQALRDLPYDLVLLDRRLPDGEGLTLVPEIRAANPGQRVIVLTALDQTSDKVAGLDVGADDYLIKPFDVEELLARIRACLRRPGATTIPPISIGCLQFDFNTRVARIRDVPILLHGKELSLLEALLRRTGQVVPRITLMGEVYGLDEETLPNAMDVLISRLRKRLSTLGAGVAIHPARGIGYLLTEHHP